MQIYAMIIVVKLKMSDVNERTDRVERRKKEGVSSPEIEGSKFRELSRRMKSEMKGE